MQDVQKKMAKVRDMLAILADHIEVTFDKDSESICFAGYTICDQELQVRSVNGTRQVPGYLGTKSFHVHNYPNAPDDVDTIDFIESKSFDEVATALIVDLTEMCLNNMLETRGGAEHFEEEENFQ